MTRTGTPVKSAQNVEIYRELVYELTKEKSDEKLVKKLMEKLGLKYSKERIDRLSQVLAFTPSPPQTKGASSDL